MSAPPDFKPSSKSSTWAVSSFVCGISSFGFWPLLTLAAIVCGHFGLSAIRKSGGLLVGRGLAIIGLILGYGGMVSVPIVTTVYLRKIREFNDANAVVAAKFDESDIVTAVQRYYAEYGQYPVASTTSEEITLSQDNSRLIQVLRSARSKSADRDSWRGDFFKEKVSDSTESAGLGPDGVFRDPWGRPYWIRINPKPDGQVANPYRKNAGPNPIPKPVIAWSLGPDGQLGVHGDGDGSADVLSWQ